MRWLLCSRYVVKVCGVLVFLLAHDVHCLKGEHFNPE